MSMHAVVPRREGGAAGGRPAALAGMAALAALMLPVAGRPVAAQRDSTRALSISTFEIEVRRVTEEMNTQRRLQLELMNLLRQSQRQAIRSTHDSVLAQAAEAQARFATERLRALVTRQEQLRHRLDSLCGADEQPDGWLGVVMNGPSEYVRDNDGPVITRFLAAPVVESVEPGSPAEKAGIRTGDILVALDGRDVRKEEIDFARLLRPGAKVSVRLLRKSSPRSLSIVVERRPESFGNACPWIDSNVALTVPATPGSYSYFGTVAPAAPDAPMDAPRAAIVQSQAPTAPAGRAVTVIADAPSAYAGPMVSLFANGSSGIAGAQLTSVDHDLGSYFDVDRGLLVLSVLQGTVALRAGLKAGDVLLSADGVDLTTPSSLQRVMNASTDHQVALVIMRNHKRQVIDLRW